ncbi:hypothetical protein RJP21_19605 [Paenibacillus sp. VCA1]|uniref:hypothetical protein n=1 Tax=Paenibacillus sp. VCA1 TaxID=3039148 RepID=UPI002870FFD7|nr:hypothetical protein [Paenibacillus sp. VCA1]MDR9855825.1 hypothetical protein [Paenibacillus sp. VCA1]
MGRPSKPLKTTEGGEKADKQTAVPNDEKVWTNLAADAYYLIKEYHSAHDSGAI